MPPFGPIKRVALIRNLRKLGFSGPYPRKQHSVMIRAEIIVRVPNPHQGDIGKDLLARILREAGISKEEWEKL
jgi:hypothetical protein